MAKNMGEARKYGCSATYLPFFARNHWGFGAHSMDVLATTRFLSLSLPRMTLGEIIVESQKNAESRILKSSKVCGKYSKVGKLMSAEERS